MTVKINSLRLLSVDVYAQEDYAPLIMHHVHWAPESNF